MTERFAEEASKSEEDDEDFELLAYDAACLHGLKFSHWCHAKQKPFV